MKRSKYQSLLKRLASNKSLNRAEARILVDKGYARRKTVIETTYSAPKDAPRWAAKYKFTRKKYGVVEHKNQSESYAITAKGYRFLKSFKVESPKQSDSSLPSTPKPVSDVSLGDAGSSPTT